MTTSIRRLCGALLAFHLAFAAAPASAQSPTGTLEFSGWDLRDVPSTGALTFRGWDMAGPTITGALVFSGRGAEPTVQAGALSFQGWGASVQHVTGALAFQGWRATSTPEVARLRFDGFGLGDETVAGDLRFAGWQTSDALPPVALAFSGFAAPQDDPFGALAFQGWQMTERNFAGSMTFDGCAASPQRADIALLSQPEVQAYFDSTWVGPNADLEGNWLIEWEDAIRPWAYATLTKGGEWECVGTAGCTYQFTRDPTAPWLADMWTPDLNTFAKEATILPSGQYQIEYYYGVLGHWGGSGAGQSNAAAMSGQWAYGDKAGRELWTRVNPRVTHVTGSEGVAYAYGTPVTVDSEYVDATVTMRGNRPSAFLQVYGEDLWGRQRFWIPQGAGIEITRVHHICASNADRRRDGFDCMPSGGVAGMEFELTIWPEALPGRHYLYLDTFTVPFDLALSGFDEPAQLAQCGL